jgi:CRISPR-associated endonuclease/helicase Cas3
MLAAAARLHDAGKARDTWQDAFGAPRDGRPYAKTATRWINQALLDGYRHEFGSLPAAEADPALCALPPELRDLALHLIAAHHGHARPLIRHGGDTARAAEVALRFARLQRRWGPWGLAWWETLLRAADTKASRQHDGEPG